jgi:nucleotide-binding universal stress UspA family protein
MAFTTAFTTSQFTIDLRIKYQKILVPHDGTEMSDKALNHGAYLSKISGSEIVVLNVIEPDVVPPSALLAFIKSSVRVLGSTARKVVDSTRKPVLLAHE